LWLLADLYGNGGLLKHVPGPVWKIVLAFLALDLMLYFWHRACHRFDGLWMFHRVHHSDAQMNVSTAFRVHILELFLTNILKGLYIIALGVDRTLLVLEETVMTFFIMTHHGNFSLPGENLLKHVIVVPRLHRAHHSVQRNEHDRNYGAVLSLWDRLFGTWTELVPSAIGIHNNPGQDVISQLKLGFTPVTPPLTSVASPRADADADADLRAMVAEAAYYKAQHRGFLPGHDLADWLEAEMEISSLIRSQDPVPVPNRPKNSTSFARCRPALSC
ncbi:MAG: sterol desaturase family protein, partial [Gammaproteobacteria bacterium]